MGLVNADPVPDRELAETVSRGCFPQHLLEREKNHTKSQKVQRVLEDDGEHCDV